MAIGGCEVSYRFLDKTKKYGRKKSKSRHADSGFDGHG